MRSLAGLAVLGCALLSACSGGRVEAEGSCAALLDWNGVRYQGSGFRLPPELGEHLGEGTYPGCDDGGGPVSEQKVQVFAVEGVDPAVAVATEGADGVWLAPAYSGAGVSYPPVLERVLLGPPCEASAPFVVAALRSSPPRPVCGPSGEAWLVAGAFRDRSVELGLPTVTWLAFAAEALAGIEGGPWEGGSDDPRELSRHVHRADGARASTSTNTRSSVRTRGLPDAPGLEGCDPARDGDQRDCRP